MMVCLWGFSIFLFISRKAQGALAHCRSDKEGGHRHCLGPLDTYFCVRYYWSSRCLNICLIHIKGAVPWSSGPSACFYTYYYNKIIYWWNLVRHNEIFSNINVPLLLMLLLFLLLLQNCSTNPAISIKSEIMDRFQSSRCLNDLLCLLDKMGSFAGGPITSMVG